MGNFELRWRAIGQALLLSAATFFFCGGALAQVNGFVVVNPIVVCDSNGANCPTFGVHCSTNTSTGAYSCTQFNTPSTATVNTPIGFVDGDNNINLTRSIMAAQAGIDVAFFPLQQYKSPLKNGLPNSNTDPWSNITPTYQATTYQHLHLKNVTCKDGIVVQASPDLAALTKHQICTEHKGVPSGVSNPPTAPSPGPPLASTLGLSNALDVFFVTDFPGQAVYGISWINGNGVSIGSSATFSSPSTGPGPRFDVLAHEIGHALALDHTTFGVGTLTNNLMTIGSSRIVPSTSGCSVTYPNTYGTNGYQNPGGGVLYDLGDPSVYPSPVPTSYGAFPSRCPPQPAAKTDQLLSGSACTTLGTCQTNSNQVGALSLSPFINQTLAVTANAGGGMQAGVAGAATASSSSSGSGIKFRVDAVVGTGESGNSTDSIIFAAPSSTKITFSGSKAATLIPAESSPGVTISDQVNINGNSGFGNKNCFKEIGLSPPGDHCYQISFKNLVANTHVTFLLNVNHDQLPTTYASQLDGVGLTTITSAGLTSAGYSTTTTFRFDSVNNVLQADSRFPDLTTPNEINLNFVNAAVDQLGPDLSKCTPPYTGSGPHQQCPGGSLPQITTCPSGVQFCND